MTNNDDKGRKVVFYRSPTTEEVEPVFFPAFSSDEQNYKTMVRVVQEETKREILRQTIKEELKEEGFNDKQ